MVGTVKRYVGYDFHHVSRYDSVAKIVSRYSPIIWTTSRGCVGATVVWEGPIQIKIFVVGFLSSFAGYKIRTAGQICLRFGTNDNTGVINWKI